MCFTVSIFASTHDVETALGAVFDENAEYEPFFHVSGFVHPSLPIVTNRDPKKILSAQWGLIPHWVKDETQAKDIAKKTLNTRSETMFEKPSFRQAAKTTRALLPVNGFVEWRHEGDVKQPHIVKLAKKPLSESLFTLGALWGEWVNPESGEILRSFSIATTQANALMSYVHNVKQRMPVVIQPQDREAWLMSNDKAEIQQLALPLDEGILGAAPVSREVSRVKVNPVDVSLLDAIGEER